MPFLRGGPPLSMFFITILTILLATGTDGFFPSDWREKYFGAGGVSHEAQTRTAFDDLAAEFFPDISPLTKTMIKARTTWSEANMKVDEDQTSSAKHFDGENFAGGQGLLVKAKTDIATALNNGDGESARNFLGAALHTLQDFYAHTNWVETKGGVINFDLGKAGVSLDHAAFADRTCNECTAGGIGRVILGCHNCDHNTDGFSQLTSGYYFGEDSPGGGISIPDWKCHHGGATDSRIGAALGVITSDAFRDVTPGINKDSNNCFFSPHHMHHSDAVDLAIKSSKQYIKDVIADGALTEKQKKLLFGVGSTMAFAIDTTGSMSGIIAAVREQAIAIANARLGTKDEPIDYVIAPFNDPFTGPVFKTTDFDTFKIDIGTLFASGGGDCPELALTGMLDAMNVMDGPADLFVMTDAAAKDFDLSSQVIDIAVEKRINLHVFKFDSFCDDGLASKRDLSIRVDSASNRVYSLLAAATGGSYHSLPTSETGSISTLLDSLTLSESVAIFKVVDTASSTKTLSYKLPIDSKMTEFSFSIKGAGFDFQITKPDGSVFDVTSAGATLTTVSDGKFLNVKNPAIGTWTATLSGAGDFTCDATGVSSLHLSKFDFVTLRGRPGHTGYYPITGQPAYDHDVAAVAMIDGDFSTATFNLRAPDNSQVISANMTAGSGADGAPPTNSFYGEMRLVPGTLFAYCEGLDAAGAPYLRMLSSVFTPFFSNTNVTGFNDTDIFAGINLNVSTSSTASLTSLVTSSTLSSTLSSTFTSSSLSTPGFYNISSKYTSTSFDSSNSASTTPYSHSLPTSGEVYPTPIYTYPDSSYTPPKTGVIYTHSKYMTGGGDTMTTTVYTTTSVCPITSTTVDHAGETSYITTTSLTTLTITTACAVLCPTCVGENYLHHTGTGPWYSADSSVALHGYEPSKSYGASYEVSGTVEGYEASPTSSGHDRSGHGGHGGYPSSANGHNEYEAAPTSYYPPSDTPKNDSPEYTASKSVASVVPVPEIEPSVAAPVVKYPATTIPEGTETATTPVYGTGAPSETTYSPATFTGAAGEMGVKIGAMIAAVGMGVVAAL